MKHTGIPVKNISVKDGKVKAIHRLAAGQKKKVFGKAKREAEAWEKRGK